MAGLSKKDQQRVLTHVQAQGATVTNTKKGYLMRFPDGKTAMMHKSESDHKAPMALRAQLRRSGISWPFDGAKAEVPKYITEGTMRASTINTWRKHTVNEAGELPEEVFASDVIRARHEAEHPGEPLPKNFPFLAAYRALYRMGYIPGGRHGTKTQGKAWVLPAEVVEERAVARAKPFAPPEMFAPEPEPTEVTVPEVRTATEEPAPPTPSTGGREFLDSEESWTLDLDTIAEIPLRTVALMMQAAGLELELRVWKK